MPFFIKSAIVIDPQSFWHNKQVAIRIENGLVVALGAINQQKDDEIIDLPDLHISPGLVDTYATIPEPGNEAAENFETGLAAAQAGGFTHIATSAATMPVNDHKSGILFHKRQSGKFGVAVHPIGAVTNQLNGKDITDMFDLADGGAVAFSNADKPLNDAGSALRAFRYASMLNLPVYVFPDDTSLAANGNVHEGVQSTRLGLKGRPVLAEVLGLSRDLTLLTQSPNTHLHIQKLSSKSAIELIADAKSKGFSVSAAVAAHHLVLTDNVLAEFDSNHKVLPPFRTDNDRLALINGLKTGVVDIICSDHQPKTVEQKDKEFDLASYGIIGFETAFGIALKALNDINLVINAMAINPRKLLQIPANTIEIGAKVDWVLYNPNLSTTFTESITKSLARNSPFFNTQIPIRIYGTLVHNTFYNNLS